MPRLHYLRHHGRARRCRGWFAFTRGAGNTPTCRRREKAPAHGWSESMRGGVRAEIARGWAVFGREPLRLLLAATAMSRMPSGLLGERLALHAGDDGAAVDDGPAYDGPCADSHGDVRECLHSCSPLVSGLFPCLNYKTIQSRTIQYGDIPQFIRIIARSGIDAHESLPALRCGRAHLPPSRAHRIKPHAKTPRKGIKMTVFDSLVGGIPRVSPVLA